MWKKYSVYTVLIGLISLTSAFMLEIIHVVAGIFDEKTIGYLAILSGGVFFTGIVSLITMAISEYIAENR
ncbi:hypothetical protein J4M81_004519 [Salmonella enterica subsp. enterica serovar Oranienburg]|nr:hypothetical protein [Salmonella enterica]EHH2060161.1 hypothetical protein [Salmonella enterica subsp. enterica serovar Oranienburg]EHH3041600.1 hypothetical protein [Salmonella enterica subsp. enterica serovar Oranienburg]EJQ3770528.1 hypothetical protein [Salmonella enterica]ELM9326497.1 hypothetical protein [Salmonella enterica]